MVRFRERNPAEMRADMDRVYALLATSCTAGAAVVMAAVLLLPLPALYRTLAPWALLWASALALWFVPAQALRVRGRVGRYAAARTLQVALMTAVLLTFVWLRPSGLTQIVIAEALGAVLALAAAHLLEGYLPRLPRDSRVRELAAAGAPFGLLALAGVVMDFADRYVITGILGVEATGYYAVAGRIAVVGTLLTGALHAMWQPHFYRLVASGRVDPRQVRATGRKLALVFTAGLAVCMALLPGLLTVTVAGRPFIAPAYQGASVLVAPLLLQYFFKVLYFLTTPAINFHGRTWRQLAMIAAAGTASVALNAVLLSVLEGPAFALLTVTALVTAGAYGIAMVYGMHEMRSLYPGASVGLGFALAASVAALIPLMGPPGLATMAATGACLVVLGLVYWRPVPAR
jgi:O-antigen/teichoic acid export membrane protein